MIEYFLKQVLSFFMTVITFSVPQEKYQKALDNMPQIAERVDRKNLSGWQFNSKISNQTGETHYYFELNSPDPKAPLLLCLHGFNTDGSVFFRLKTLSDKFRIIAYNFPDKSSYYNGKMKDFQILLDDFCRIMAIDTITLLGYSLGGGIALNFAATTTVVDIKELILISTTVFGSTPENKRQMRGMADKLLKYPDYKLYALLIMGGNILNKLEKPQVQNNVPNESIVIKHVDWYKQVLKSFYWYEGILDAKDIRCPVVVIHGKNDKLMNVKEIEAVKKVFPDARYHVFNDAAHSLVWSHAENVEKILRE